MTAGGRIDDGASRVDVLDAVADDLEEGLVVAGADGRILRLNGAAALLLDADPAGALGQPVEVFHDFRVALMVRACAAEGAVTDRDLSEATEGRHLLARAVPVRGSDGSVQAVALLLRDLSRLRRLETVRRDFVANVSHELRTPIAAIQLLVETLQGGALDEAEIAGEFVSRIGLEVSHMAQIVAELLELSAIESGPRPLRAQPIPADELFAAAARLHMLAEERGIEVRHEVAAGTPPVLGDAPRLAEVVRNLVHNAIKFTPRGGSITLSARPLAATDADAANVELRVSDTGVGVAPEDAERIFERFYKADKSRQRDGEGTGLGLAIARHTVQAHGGSIRVESEPGRGATFVIVLPAAAPAADGR